MGAATNTVSSPSPLDPLGSFDEVAWPHPEIDAAPVAEVDREKHARRVRRDRAGCAGRAYRHRSVRGLSLPDAVLSDEDGVALDDGEVGSQARGEAGGDDGLLRLEVVQRSTRLALLVPPGKGRDGGDGGQHAGDQRPFPSRLGMRAMRLFHRSARP